MPILKLESKLNNLILEYHNRLLKWLETHTRLPKVVHNFINVDKQPNQMTVSDFFQQSLDGNVVKKFEVSSIVKTKSKKTKTFSTMNQVSTNNYYTDLKTIEEVEVSRNVVVSNGEWVENSSKSVAFCDGMIGEVSYIENAPTQYSITIEDSIKSLKMTSKMQVFLQEFPNLELQIDSYEAFIHIRKNLQQLIENDNLLSLVEKGVVRIKEDLSDEVIIKYEAKLNKLTDLLMAEKRILKSIENQRQTIQLAKRSLMIEHEEYVYVIMNQEEKQIVCVDKELFFTSMVQASKEFRRATMSLSDQVSKGVEVYNNCIKMMTSKRTALDHLIEFCDEADLQDLRLEPLRSEMRRLDVVDGYNSMSDEDIDDEYMDYSD